MEFLKLHAVGNDFIIIQDNWLSAGINLPDLARNICNRHYGIGSDGMIILGKEPHQAEADFSIRIFNADGSEAEISGNGIRCVGAYVWYLRLLNSDRIKIETVSGVKELEFLAGARNAFTFRADMGRPIFAPEQIPFIVPEKLDKVINYPLEAGTEKFYVTALSFGNPHCALFFKNLVDIDIDHLGLLIENHPAFPNRTNVELIEVTNRREIKVTFWERGVGRTLSSGSGSCSAAIAATLNGLTDDCVTVNTAGGALEVEWKDRNHVFLTGSAEIICRGEYLFPPLWK